MSSPRIVNVTDVVMPGTPGAGKLYQTDADNRLVEIDTSGASDGWTLLRDSGLWVVSDLAAAVNGLPAGGVLNDVLTKQSGTDYDAAWQAPADGSGGGAPTTPPITPRVWFKADAGVTVNGSNQPTAVTNHGSDGGTFTLDGTVTKRGTIVAAGQNGKDVLRLDGDDYLQFDFGSTITHVHVMAFFALRKRASGSSPRALFSAGKSGASSLSTDSRFVVYMPDAIDHTFAYHTNGTEILQPVVFANATQGPHWSTQLVEIAKDGDTLQNSYNGVIERTPAANTKAAAALDVNRLLIGAWATDGTGNPTGFGLNMDLFEVLFFTSATAFSESDRNGIRRYVASRWMIPVAAAA